MFVLIWLIWEEAVSDHTNLVELTRVDRKSPCVLSLVLFVIYQTFNSCKSNSFIPET